MIKIKIFSFLFFILISFNNLLAKEPSTLITEIVNEASLILSSSDPVESKIIKLNNIAEINVDIEGIGMYTLGKYRKTINEEQKIKYKKQRGKVLSFVFDIRIQQYNTSWCIRIYGGSI